MCFLKKHSHQNHKWTASGEVWCCWTNRDHFVDEHKPSTAREHSSWKAKLQGSLEKANSFCNPQGGNDSERRDSYPGPTIFPGEQTFSVKHCSTGGGSPVTDLSRGTEPAAWVLAKWNCPGKSIHLENVEPKHLPAPSTCRRFLLFFKRRTSSLTSFRFIFNYF